MPDPFAAMNGGRRNSNNSTNVHHSRRNSNNSTKNVHYSRNEGPPDDDSANAAWKPERICRPKEISIVVFHKNDGGEGGGQIQTMDDDDEEEDMELQPNMDTTTAAAEGSQPVNSTASGFAEASKLTSTEQQDQRKNMTIIALAATLGFACLALVILVLWLVVWSDSGSSTGTGISNGSTIVNTLEEIQNRGKVRCGVREGLSYRSFKNKETGKLEGFSVDLVRACERFQNEEFLGSINQFSLTHSLFFF